MDVHIDRHQPLITARLIFAPKALPPPPIIAARMDFPTFSIPQYREWSPTHENPGERSLTPKRHTTPKRAPTPKRQKRLQRHSVSRTVTFENNMDVDRDSDTATTPKRRLATSQGVSAALEIDGDLGSPLTSLSDEDGELESEEDGEMNSTRIPKPPGEAGRPQSGGYSLQDKLGWNDKTYESVIVRRSKVYMKDSDRNL
jgi:hypothetical protein